MGLFMQIVSNYMKCQILFSGKYKKNNMNLSSAELNPEIGKG